MHQYLMSAYCILGTVCGARLIFGIYSLAGEKGNEEADK